MRVASHGFIREVIVPGAVVHTDGLPTYQGLDGYEHRVTVVKKRAEPDDELLSRVHRAISPVKRWLLGMHRWAVSHEHLEYYLDEFAFGVNQTPHFHL